jgi:hypothetical protein
MSANADSDWKPIDDLDLHIRQALATYPMLFKTRKDVLQHIFIVLGSGYEWGEDGRLYTFEMDNKDEPRQAPPVAEIPQPDVMTCTPHPSMGIASKIPENTVPLLRQAAEEAIADWKVAMEKVAAAKERERFPAALRPRQEGENDEQFVQGNLAAAVWMLERANELGSLWRHKHPQGPEDLPIEEKLASREESEQYQTLSKKFNDQAPELAERVFALRHRFYMGCGFQYDLEKSYGALLRRFNDHDSPVHMLDSLNAEVSYKMFIESLEEKEKSAEIHSAMEEAKRHRKQYNIVRKPGIQRAKALCMEKNGKLPKNRKTLTILEEPFEVKIRIRGEEVTHTCIHSITLEKTEYGSYYVGEWFDENVPKK